MNKETLYWKDKNNSIRVWYITWQDNWYKTGSYVYSSDKIKETEPTYVTGKNIGRANETTTEEQLNLEVESKIKKQIDKGYSYEIPSDTKRFDVSLAGRYQDRQVKNLLNFPYHCEPKLDGIRCYIKNCDGKIKMFSRKHKEFVSCPHITESNFVQKFFKLVPCGILDGELYNHKLKDNFEKIVSLVRKQKVTADDLKETKELINFYCFDFYDPTQPEVSYYLRKKFILDIIIGNSDISNDPFICVKPLGEIHDEKTADLYLKQCIEEGYEGIMLKKDVPYFFGRSNDLLKYKTFLDKEFKIVSFEEGKGNAANMAASVICEDTAGNKFSAAIKATQEYKKDLWENRVSYVGKLATIKYQALTGTGGVPRFGQMIAIREDT